MSKRSRYIRDVLRQGPTEAGYAFFRARRRRRNLADDDHLLPGDRLVRSPGFAVEREDIEANARAIEAQLAAGEREIRTVSWLIPSFDLVWAGGMMTLLRFADRLAREHGVRHRFVVFDDADPAIAERVGRRIGQAFPALAGCEVQASGGTLAGADAAIATAWEGGWRLVRAREVGAKFMFVQDWEPDFYPAGSASAMLDELARQGIPALVNSPGLAESYRAAGGPALAFTPAVDTELFRPADARPAAPVQIVFYGRPMSPRNAFGLGLETLRRVKERHGDAVRIVCAGADWTPGQYGMAGVIENAGQLRSLDEVARLYRDSHIGLVFMLSRHPSYQPLEFMASGVATVTNVNPHTAWLLEDGANALLSPPVPALVADRIARLVEDAQLRDRLAAAGRARVEGLEWAPELDRLWQAMTGRLAFEPPTAARRSAAPRD